MNINKFTQKSIQAVNDLEKIAYEYGNQEIEEEHLLYCLLNQEDSLILKLIEKMEINKDELQRSLIDALNKRPKVSGGQVYIGKDLNRVLVSAEDEAKASTFPWNTSSSPCSVIPTPVSAICSEIMASRETVSFRLSPQSGAISG